MPEYIFLAGGGAVPGGKRGLGRTLDVPHGGELLDLALFGVVQQPEARGGPERTEAEEKNL